MILENIHIGNKRTIVWGNKVSDIIANTKPTIQSSENEIVLNWKDIVCYGCKLVGKSTFFPGETKVKDRLFSHIEMRGDVTLDDYSRILEAIKVDVGNPTSDMEVSFLMSNIWEFDDVKITLNLIKKTELDFKILFNKR